MRLITTFILIIISTFITFAQQNVYLKNNKSGHLKELKRKTILTFKTSDSTWVTGRIIAVTDSSFSVSTYEKHTEPDTVSVQINSVSQVTNKLTNKGGLFGPIIGYIGLIGIVTSPFLLIADTPENALGLLEASAVLLGTGIILYSPHLIKKNFNTNKWTMFTK